MRKLFEYASSPVLITWISGAISSIAYGYLAYNSQYYGDATLWQLLGVSGLCAAMCCCTWLAHYKADQNISLVTLVGFAIIYRVIGVFTFPVLEDDFYRYLWDARNTWELGSPYGIAPATFFTDGALAERYQDILDGINYPFIATIYGPTCQWIFALAYAISPGEVWPLKFLIAAIDFGVVLLLLKLAKPNNVLLYAWSPLLIKEFAISAHPDVLGAFLVVLALLLYQRKNMILVGCCLALAAGVKIFALLLLPFFLRFYWRAWMSFLLTAMVIALPFGVLQAWFPSGLQAMNSDWLFNAPIYVFLKSWASLNTIKYGLLACLATGCALYLFNEIRHHFTTGNRAELHSNLRVEWLFLGLFLCIPALNAWYLVWLLPFAVLRPSIWAWVTSVTILLSYASGINLHNTQLEPYEIQGWVIAIEFGLPVFAALALLNYQRRKL